MREGRLVACKYSLGKGIEDPLFVIGYSLFGGRSSALALLLTFNGVSDGIAA